MVIFKATQRPDHHIFVCRPYGANAIYCTLSFDNTTLHTVQLACVSAAQNNTTPPLHLSRSEVHRGVGVSPTSE